MALQTVSVAAQGGLDLESTPQALSQTPGAASVLNNYESLIEGGYRKINGFRGCGDIPDVIAEEEIRGLACYQGVVVVIGNRVLHSPDGETWNVVNKKDVKDTSDECLTALDLIPREGEGAVSFSRITTGADESLVITDSVNGPAELTVVKDLYTYTLSDNKDIEGYKYCIKYQDHIVYASSDKKPGSLAVSDRFNPLGFTGSGSWEAKVSDTITGLHTFRDNLYIFCLSSIYRVQNLESQADVTIRPVTTKVGCLDGRSIQEIGGDVLFLSAAGLRYLSATERIDDVDINLVSSKITSLLTKVAPTQGAVSSVVIPSKSQYRLFYTDYTGVRKGILGTIMLDGTFSWSTMDNMLVEAIDIDVTSDDEQIFHIGSPITGSKRVYKHDIGSTFDGTPFKATWSTPDFDMGDSAVRKSLHFIDTFLETEDLASIAITVTLDHESKYTMQPESFQVAPVIEAARWGEVKWGAFEYGAIRYPIDEVFLEGSGKWIKITFKDNADDNSPYILRGFDLQVTPSGRI